MGDVYKGATKVRLTLDTGQDFTVEAPTTSEICYRNPSGTEGVWTATNDADNLDLGYIYVDFSTSGYFTEKGTWWLWAKLTYSDSRVAYGRPVSYVVNNPGKY